jgi:hypothetical protein
MLVVVLPTTADIVTILPAAMPASFHQDLKCDVVLDLMRISARLSGTLPRAAVRSA